MDGVEIRTRSQNVFRVKTVDLTFLVPVRSYEKECSGENVEFVGIAA